MSTISIEENKAVVLRFNKEIIEQGNYEVFAELMDEAFVNRTALPNISSGPDGMIVVFKHLQKGFPDLKVEIYDQIAEGDKVTTRKALIGTHTGDFMGIAATNRKVTINVIDIVCVRNGRYFEHWGMNNLQAVMSQLKEA